MEATLGRKGDYSVRGMLFVATHYGQRQKSREIAKEMGIPPRYLPQILANLVQHGLLDAMAGPTGGYCLARPPEEISLLEVVEAAEGSIKLERCVLQGGPCDWENACPVHIPWARAQNAMAEELRATTLAQLVANAAELAEGTHELPADTPSHTFPTPRIRRKGSAKKQPRRRPIESPTADQ